MCLCKIQLYFPCVYTFISLHMVRVTDRLFVHIRLLMVLLLCIWGVYVCVGALEYLNTQGAEDMA